MTSITILSGTTENSLLRMIFLMIPFCITIKVIQKNMRMEINIMIFYSYDVDLQIEHTHFIIYVK